MVNVIYWEINGRKKVKYNEACFSYIVNYGRRNQRILYKCLVDTSLSQIEIDFYLNFLKQILGNSFTWHRSGYYMFFRFKCNGFSPSKTLMYLTAFRYLDEFPSVVSAFFGEKESKNGLEELFIKFQEIHFKVMQGNLKTKYGNMSGHGLIYNYAWCSQHAKFTSISLEQFAKNLTNTYLQRVHDFFLNKDLSKTAPAKNIVKAYKEVEIGPKFGIRELKKVELFA